MERLVDLIHNLFSLRADRQKETEFVKKKEFVVTHAHTHINTPALDAKLPPESAP